MQLRYHSKLGIVSFGLGLAVVSAVLLILIGSFIPEDGTYFQRDYNNFIFVFSLIIAPVFYLVGLIAGIIDVFRKKSKKVFPVLGIIINGLASLIAAIWWILIILLGIAIIGAGGVWM